MDATKALEQARRDAVALANRRVRDMQRRLWADGVEDRVALGKPDPWVPANAAEAWGAANAALLNGIEQFARSIAKGFAAVRLR
jgi:hypothetical protein